MLTHTLKQGHDVPPLKDIMARAVAAGARGEVLACSLFGGFPMADIPHVGFSAVAVADGDAGRAARHGLAAARRFRLRGRAGRALDRRR